MSQSHRPQSVYPTAVHRRHWLALALCSLLLAGCGGGGGGGGGGSLPPEPDPPPVDTDNDGLADDTDTDDDGDGVADTEDAFPLDPERTVDPAVFPDADQYAGYCAAPRSGASSVTGRAFEDRQGWAHDEKLWLRSWSDDLYLWYDEIEHVDPVGYDVLDYFDELRTFARTPSGNRRDRFHFTSPTEAWERRVQSGVSAGYGVEWVLIARRPPREVVVAFTEPGSPATEAGLARGARVIAIDGVDVEDGDADTINAGLFPETTGEPHEFVVRDPGADETRTVTLTSAEIASQPVQHAQVLQTSSGPVGYMFFTTHIAPAEAQLVEAMERFEAEGIVDLVVDLRYNGGGLLDIANQLAFMIAGPTVASGRTFDELRFNDKHTEFNPVTGRVLRPTPFHQTTLGFAEGLPEGEPLPAVHLPRVFLLTSGDTCSASEAVINGLRGIDVEVILVGTTTCGKPYGFYPEDNCGTTYFTIQFTGVNAKGFGDYPDGFSPANLDRVEGVEVPGCAVGDDFGHPLGSTDEAMLATALAYRETGACPVSDDGEASPAALSRPGLPDDGQAIGRPGPGVSGPPWMRGAWITEQR